MIAIEIIICLATGFFLGCVFYGGLWMTVRRLATARHPAGLAMGSRVMFTGPYGVREDGTWQEWLLARPEDLALAPDARPAASVQLRVGSFVWSHTHPVPPADTNVRPAEMVSVTVIEPDADGPAFVTLSW